MPRSLPLLVPVLVVLAGCGIDEDVVAREAAIATTAAPAGTASASTTTTAPPPPARPFAVGAPPEGYELLVAGPGEAEPGDERPVTVLAPDGEPVGAGVVLVEGVVAEDTGFAPADDDTRWASLTRDDVRVWGIEATEEELAAVADAVVPPADARTAPVIEDPPAGLGVVGSIQADGVLGRAAAAPGSADDPVPGPGSAQVAVYADGASSLVVLALPAGSLDPGAVVTEAREPRRIIAQPRDAVAEDVAVGDETGVVVTTAESASGTVVRRDLAVAAPGADVVLLISRGPEILDAATLAAVAASISPA